MSRKIKKRIGRVCLYLMVFVIVLTVVAPFGWMVISSISTKADLLQRPMRWFPKNPSFEIIRRCCSALPAVQRMPLPNSWPR